MNHDDAISNRRFILAGALLVWLLFVASFFMPVASGIDMVGWQAFWYYLSETWDLPDYWRQITNNPSALLISTFPSTNGAVFIAPLILFRWSRWSGALGFALALGGLVPIVCFFEMIAQNELLVGYYCWVASICLMAVVSFLCAKSVKAMPFRRRAASLRTAQPTIAER